MSKFQKGDFDHARDELMSHVHRCNVLDAEAQQQEEWLDDTIGYLGERYPSLSPEQLGELRTVGLRFCQPVIAHGRGNTALTQDAETETQEAETEEMATAGV